jgi:hypothetical protein
LDGRDERALWERLMASCVWFLYVSSIFAAEITVFPFASSQFIRFHEKLEIFRNGVSNESASFLYDTVIVDFMC